MTGFRLAVLLVLMIGTALPVARAVADCSHRDYRDKQARLEARIAARQASDPAAAAALRAKLRAIVAAAPEGDIVGLGHACGQLDDLLMHDGQ